MAQVALVLVALVVIGLPMATDAEWRTVQTGSMRPAIEPGDVVLVAPTDEVPVIGDLVVFEDPIERDRDVVHRLVGFDADGRAITRGDANSIVDPWALDTPEVMRTVTLQIPKAGHVIQAMSSKAGIFVFLVVPAIAIIASESRVWYRYVRYGAEAFEQAPRGRHLAVGAS